MSSSDRFVLYEYPFSERIRTLLRLEDLFERLAFFQAQTHPHCHHAALLTLFEILEITSRSDLKGELLQELERHRQTLLALRNNPQVAEERLAAVLVDVESAHTALNTATGKVGQQLRDNEWLTLIRSRASIPGGTSEFDVPWYHAWLCGDPAARSADLDSWVQQLAQFSGAMNIVLRLLRGTAHSTRQTAAAGAFQLSLQGRTCSLLQVRVAASEGAIPEISANKYMLWIRFGAAERDLKPRAVDRDIGFELSLCSF
jgi:cell division protein ZapD